MMTSWLQPQRKCGECQACCNAIAVVELRKPFHVDCEHQCASGCGIYPSRPDSCAGYLCGWLMGLGTLDDRPDKLGAVLHHESDEHGLWLQVHVMHKDVDRQRILDLGLSLVQIANLRGMKIVAFDQIMNTTFKPDLEKYPGYANIKEKMVWATRDDVIYVLSSPKRFPLKVVT